MGLRPEAPKYHQDQKQIADLHARISQETFDAAVQENIDEFDMEPEEALADAISQFESQGVNLSNIVKRVPGAAPENDPPAVVALRELKKALEEAADADDAEEEVIAIDYGGGVMKMTFMTQL